MKLPNKFSYFPVEGKKPALETWKKYQTQKPTEEEKNSWNGSPKAIVTGKISGILVLDDDGGLAGGSHQIPPTLTQRTPRGGKHYFFRWVPALDNKVTTKLGVLPKVDTRGEGGYVVYYGFDKPFAYTPMADPPQWLIDLLPDRNLGLAHLQGDAVGHPKTGVAPLPTKFTDNGKYSQALEQLKHIEPGAGSKGRTPTFVRVIAKLKAMGLSSKDTVTLLQPWANQYDYGNRIERLVYDQYKRYPPETRMVDADSPDIDSFLQDEQVVEWIVPGVIAKGSIGFIAGLPQTSKTFISIDLAVEMATDNTDSMWLNKFKTGGPIRVLFIDQERSRVETSRRFKAVIKGKNLKPSQLKDNLFIRCGTSTRLDLQHSFDAFRKVMEDIRPDLVIVDSFATFHTSQENDRQSIQKVLERVKELRNEFGSTFLFIHHENKSAYQRGEEASEPSIAHMAGNVAIPAAAETVLTVRRHEEGASMVYHTKSTMGSALEPFLVSVKDLDEEKTMISVEAH